MATEPPTPPAEPTASIFETERFDDFGYAMDRPSLGAMMSVARLSAPYLEGMTWVIPLVLVFGIMASLAEGLGVGVIVLLLSLLISGDVHSMGAEDGLLGRVIEKALAFTNGSLPMIALLAFGLILLRVISISAHRTVTTLVEARISDRVRRKLFSAVLTMPLEELSRRRYGDVLTVVDRHSWSVAEAIDSLANIILNGVIALIVGGLLFALSPLVAIIAVAGTLLLNFGLRRFDGPAERAGLQASEAARDVNARVIRVLQAMRTVRAFGQQESQIAGYATDSKRLRSAAMRSDIAGSLPEPISHLAYIGMIAAIAILARRQSLSYELILASVALLYRMHPYASAFEQQRLHLATLLAPLQAVDELAALAPKPAPRRVSSIARFSDALRFETLTFGYVGQPTPCLQDATFEIPARGWTFLEGESGSGKSTVVNLLLGLYPPLSGRVTVDGVDLAEIEPQAWLSQVAVAGQDVELVDGSLLENIRIGAPDASTEEVNRLIELVGLDEVVKTLENGADTRVGERGLALSGGQRQRIGIARALLRRPALLVLDEATSALDRRSERLILDHLVAELQDQAVLVIGHRSMQGLPIANRITLGAAPVTTAPAAPDAA